MARVFEIRVIKPDRMKTEVFDRAIKKSLDKGAKIIQKSFKETMSTWRNKAPVVVDSGRGKRLIWVDSDVYTYLNDGTKIRWALMSRNWRSKTSPGRLKPGPGRGNVVIAGRRAMQRRGISPRPGIKARNFDEQIVRRDSKPVQRIFKRELSGAARRAF